MLANWQQWNENPETFLYLYLDIGLDLDLIIFNLLMFYHLQNMFTCIIFKAISHDWSGHRLPRVAHFVGSGLGAEAGAKPSACFTVLRFLSVVRKSQCNLNECSCLCFEISPMERRKDKERNQECEHDIVFPCGNTRNVHPQTYSSSMRNQLNKKLDLG